jgi:hypothetical protein
LKYGKIFDRIGDRVRVNLLFSGSTRAVPALKGGVEE